MPKPAGKNTWTWEMLNRDAKGLGLATPAPRAWVRWSFRLGLEGFS